MFDLTNKQWLYCVNENDWVSSEQFFSLLSPDCWSLLKLVRKSSKIMTAVPVAVHCSYFIRESNWISCTKKPELNYLSFTMFINCKKSKNVWKFTYSKIIDRLLGIKWKLMEFWRFWRKYLCNNLQWVRFDGVIYTFGYVWHQTVIMG